MMELRGELTGTMRSLDGDLVQLRVDRTNLDKLNAMQGKRLDISVGVHREKRSLNANAYFHVLVHKLAAALGTSENRMKNMLITEYGVPEIINDQITVIKTNIPERVMLELDSMHCKPIKAEKNATFYQVFRGSHTYNTAEMARLIDGTVEDCKEQGIETLPPAELEALKATWAKN